MNKVVIAGHPYSGYQDVELLLNKCGMQAAAPSRDEGMTPVEINAMLSQAHGIPLFGQPGFKGKITQVPVGAVWNGVALDLMRGNLDQAFWGWSDPQMVYFLDYWKSLDPTILFVFVYNHPRTMLSLDPEVASDLTSEGLELRIAQWIAYNSAILNFHLRNKERSLLVHADQVGISAKNYVEQIRNYFNEQQGHQSVPLLAEPENLQEESEPVEVGESNKSDLVAKHLWLPTFNGGKENVLKQYVAEDLVAIDPEAEHLYQELQASASLPKDMESGEKSDPLAAWRLMAELQKRLHVLEIDSKEAQNENTELQKRLQDLENSSTETQGENDLLLLQLHQVQEELETKYLQGQQTEVELREVQRQQSQEQKRLKNQLSQKEKELVEVKQKLSQQQQKLESQLNQKKADADYCEMLNENEMLLLQLHQVQEELERYYLENRELKINQQPVHYGAVDRLKNDFTYQMGATIISSSRKLLPIPFLPLILWRVTKRIRKEQEGANLPLLTDYRDYHEAEKVRKHLSYQLGVVWQKHIRTPWGWIYMPFALIGARIAYRRGRKAQGK